ncbi:hypothetical protein NUW58_g2298 [Xylaria curta]|uniref:Uncharacterized protein n=1 Tax=Xylaria curta TaxID=42375 RepID=A0ACC1PG99_9PEZI|nr:hypothetical protein NUW58_g2298 [Xylaria curta]
MVSEPEPFAEGSPSLVTDVSGATWTPLFRRKCSFDPGYFFKVMNNLILNPNINSSWLFRADILLERDGTQALSQDIEGEVDATSPIPVPILVQFTGFRLDKLLVRRLIPRNPQRDPPLDQTCLIYHSNETGEMETSSSMVVYKPHVSSHSDVPFYHPKVSAVAFLHEWDAKSGEGTVSIHYNFFDDYSSSPKLVRTALHLLSTLHKHGEGAKEGYVKRVQHDTVIPQATVQSTYTRLKKKYARKLIEGWVEVTDPTKHCFEDLGIAAFLIELWAQMYRDSHFPGFVDIGCGNGLLVHILRQEGYLGWGFDARRRKSWDNFTDRIDPTSEKNTGQSLRQLVLLPSVLQDQSQQYDELAQQVHDGMFPQGTFIISNHADELTPWTPVLAAISDCPFIMIPCCSHDLSGARFRAAAPKDKGKSTSAYSSLVEWVKQIAYDCGWNVETEMLRIPSTRNTGIIGRHRPQESRLTDIMSYGKKDEDADLGLVKVDRTQVFQEARLFNSSPIQPRRCRILLTKIALLLYTGEKFPTNEATTLFFGISKLFQNKDASLRQMVHLVIKELANSAEDIIMVTSTIMKDTGGSTDAIYRPNAIRALCRIIDATTVQSIERVMKTAIVDKNPSVSSAALVSSYHLLPIAKDVVRRWQSETQEAAASTKSSGGFSLGFSSSSGSLPVNNSTMTQYHAIGLLYQMRSHDRMALVKMVQQFGAAGAVKSPAAIVMLVRLAAQLAEEDQSLRKPMMQLLDGWLRHKSEMVNFEAAKAICDMRDVTDAEVTQAVHVLQLFLSSPRAVTKFAALRILHNFASFKPNAVNVCNPDIEALISNANRSIATFAITTLLKTGNEASVDRLMKQISSFMSEITDEFKITIVEAIRTLCLKFPSKQAGMLAFLSGILRDEGGYEFKRAVVESMFDLIKFVPDSKEDALAHLCEFIEDCEFTKLAVRILHLLGLEGPKTSQPTKYIRYIYNRVVLENAIVRAAAVTALAKFGVGQKDPEVKRSVDVLLTRCLDDVDDEVRDRAALNLRLMHEEDDLGERFIKNENMFSLQYFEHQLVTYVTSDDKSAFDIPFDISKIPVVTREQADAEDRTKKLTASTPSLKPPKTGPSKAPSTGAEAQASAAAAAQKYAQELMSISYMKEFGGLLKSSSVVELTEAETEYVVTLVKHIFKEHIVLQYEIKNTLPSTVLENVTVVATPSDEEELEEVFIIPAEKLETDEPGKVYVAFKKTGGEGSMPTSSFSNVLKFTSKEIDPTTNEPEETGYDDEYEVAEFDLAGSDYVIPAFAGNFNHIWEQVGAAGEEAEETLQLSSMKSIAGMYLLSRDLVLRQPTDVMGSDATEQLAKALSLQPLEGTDVPISQTTHQLKLLGKTVNGGRVVANIRMAYSSKSGVTTKITVRSEEENVAALIVASVA